MIQVRFFSRRQTGFLLFVMLMWERLLAFTRRCNGWLRFILITWILLLILRVVNHFKSDIADHSEFNCIISACRQLFIDSFQNSYVEFNRRQANGVAHELAQVAPSHASSHVYDDVPSCIRFLIDNE